jgi:hypothetical protein
MPLRTTVPTGLTGTTGRAGRTSRVARLLVVCAALLGLFAMHGLADHGAVHGKPDAAGAMSMSMSPSTHDTTITTVHLGEVPVVENAESVTTGMSGMGAMGMCVAVLTLLLLLVGLSPSRGLLRRWTLLRAGVLAPVVRGRPPPSLTLLSIQRC